MKFPKNLSIKPKKFSRDNLRFLETDDIKWSGK